MGKVKEFLGLGVTCIVAFVAAGCVSVLGLLCWRLMARDVGGSIYTWTAGLGLALAGLCLGGRFGGGAADRYNGRRILAVLYALLSAACVGIIMLSHALVGWDWLWGLSWPVHVFLHVGLVLLPPAVLLGGIVVVTVKHALELKLAPGRTIGDLLMWSTGGAVLGTFLAGFYLIPRFDSVTMVWAIGAAMLGIAMLYWMSCWALYLWAMIFGTLATMGMAPASWAHEAGVGAYLREPSDPGLVYEDQTAGGAHVMVRRLSDRPQRRVLLSDRGQRIEAVVGRAADLQSVTDRICAGLTEELGQGKETPSMLILGGRGYFLAQWLQNSRPGGSIELVEPDAGVIEASERTLGMASNPTVKIVTMDARHYIEQCLQLSDANEPARKYDFVYQEFNAGGSVPFQLVTTQFNEKLASLLAPDAVYMVALSDVFEDGRFLGAVVATLEQTFPHVHVLRGPAVPASWPETFVVVATPRVIDPAALLASHDAHLPVRSLDESAMADLTSRGQGTILTDDLAPVDNLLAPAAQQLGPKKRASRCLRRAEVLQARGMDGRSQRMYRRAVALDPSLSVRACTQIGLMHLDNGDVEPAAEAFAQAIRSRRELDLWAPEIAAVHRNLGLLLRRMNEPAEARKQLLEAAKWFRIDLKRRGDSVVLWERLGDTLVLTGDMKEASEAFEKALELEPENAAHYMKLTKALELQRRYGEAIGVAKRHLALLKERGDRDAAARLGQYVELLEYEKVKAGM